MFRHFPTCSDYGTQILELICVDFVLKMVKEIRILLRSSSFVCHVVSPNFVWFWGFVTRAAKETGFGIRSRTQFGSLTQITKYLLCFVYRVLAKMPPNHLWRHARRSFSFRSSFEKRQSWLATKNVGAPITINSSSKITRFTSFNLLLEQFWKECYIMDRGQNKNVINFKMTKFLTDTRITRNEIICFAHLRKSCPSPPPVTPHPGRS